jgi:hypothetical protein
MSKRLLVLLLTALVVVAAAGTALARTDSGQVGARGSRVCRQPAGLDKMLALTRTQGFTIAPGALRALKSLPTPTPAAASGRDPARVHVILVGTKGSRQTATGTARSVQKARVPTSSQRVAVSDHAALGCPVGAPAHVWWDSGFGAVSEVWRWATIGGQVGSTVGPPAPNCGYTTCRWYAWINGVQNRYYRSVDVYNGIYAFIESAGCYY